MQIYIKSITNLYCKHNNYNRIYKLITGWQDNISLNLLKLTDAHSEPSLYVVVTFKNWITVSILISSNELFCDINGCFSANIEVDFNFITKLKLVWIHI